MNVYTAGNLFSAWINPHKNCYSKQNKQTKNSNQPRMHFWGGKLGGSRKIQLRPLRCWADVLKPLDLAASKIFNPKMFLRSPSEDGRKIPPPGQNGVLVFTTSASQFWDSSFESQLGFPEWSLCDLAWAFFHVPETCMVELLKSLNSP